MAKNSLTGSVIAPLYFGPGLDQAPGNILSGNLSTSDGADVINVPRVSLANADSLVINTGGDPNTLRCSTALTFDGDTLNVTGEITASTGMSASYFMGDGSRLTGVVTEGIGGIFTQIDATKAFTTSSIQVGSNATPANTLSVAGSSYLSGAVVFKRALITTNYTVTTSDHYLGVNSPGSIIKLTLPLASNMTDGQTIVVKDEAGTANSYNITISNSVGSADTIDGQNLIVLESPYASVRLYCDGINKYFIT